MDSAAHTMDNLSTLLAPHFDIINNGVKDVKENLTELTNQVGEIHDAVLTTSAEVEHIKSRIADNETRIRALEEISYDNRLGVHEFRRARHLAYIVLGAVVSAVSALGAWGFSMYMEYSHKQEELEIRHELVDQYKQVSDELKTLKGAK